MHMLNFKHLNNSTDFSWDVSTIKICSIKAIILTKAVPHLQ